MAKDGNKQAIGILGINFDLGNHLTVEQSEMRPRFSGSKADQRPGDMIMPDGSKINISDIQKLQNAK